MSKSRTVSAKAITIGEDLGDISKPLEHKLRQFTEEHYRINNRSLFISSILKPGHPGEIICFYGESDELVGYTRIYRQPIHSKAKQSIVYYAHTFNNPTHDTRFLAARLGLTQTMKYKLSHPDEELMHFSCVNNPAKYQFLAQLCNTIYPKPNHEVPKKIIQLVNVLKKSNNWQSCTKHPMLIDGQLVPKQPHAEIDHDNPFIQYYRSLNPYSEAGQSLLVCIPLSIDNIGHGIRQLLTQSVHDHSTLLMDV